MRPALARHDALVRAAVERAPRHRREDDRRRRARGVRRSARRARAPRCSCSRRSPIPPRPRGVALRVRCGLHAGVDRAARQRLLRRRRQPRRAHHERRARRPGAAVAGGRRRCVGERLPADVALRDLGTVRLRDLASPERVYPAACIRGCGRIFRRCARSRRRRTTCRSS